MSDPWVKFYASDWLAGTSGLTAAERGTYITIVCLIYEYDGPVPLDRTRLARRCGLPAGSFKRVLEALIDDGKLIETPDGLINERAMKEIGDRQNRITKAQSGARKTNAIRAEKKQQKQQNEERQASSGRNANQNQNQSIKEEDKSSSQKKRGSRLPDDWVLPREWGQWALSQQWPEVAVRAEAEKFRDYWHSVAGQKGVKRDWFATWRNWMRNSSNPKLSAIHGGKYEPSSKSEDRLQAFVAGARGTP